MINETDICVIGGGPAGSTIALRLAQFGWRVCLAEQASFPRRHLGESLTPGVLPLLTSIGLGPVVEQAGYPRVDKLSVRWEVERERADPGLGLLVDRGHFDKLLLEQARKAGVRVVQPAKVLGNQRRQDGWTVALSQEGVITELRAKFVVDASGRASVCKGRRRSTGPRTLALHAYWTGTDLPVHPRIESSPNGWYWGVPLPDGLYNTLVFLDPTAAQAKQRLGESAFRQLLGESSLLTSQAGATLVGRVMATNATPYLRDECVTDDFIAVGDAAMALDPLSSSGVQKAIQSSLAGAVVVNTLLRRPEARGMAREFYRQNLAEVSSRHRQWAQDHYRLAAPRYGTRFWTERATPPPGQAAPVPERSGFGASGGEPPLASNPTMASDTPMRLSERVEIIEAPCLVGRFVEPRPAVAAPWLERPVAYLGDAQLAPLLRCVRDGITPRDLVACWLPMVPPGRGAAIAQWLVQQGLLVRSSRPSASRRGRAK